MPIIEQEVRGERMVSYLLWKAIDSQLELEKATEKLMKDIYEELERMKAAGTSLEDWTTMCDMAQQLIDTLEKLRDDRKSESVEEEENVEIKVEENIKAEEQTKEEAEQEIEAYIELLMREMHPNLDQIRAEARLGKEDFHDMFGLAKQMAKPHRFTEEEDSVIWKKDEKYVKEKKKQKKQKKNREGGNDTDSKEKEKKKKKDKVSGHAPKHRSSRRILSNDFQEDGSSNY